MSQSIPLSLTAYPTLLQAVCVPNARLAITSLIPRLSAQLMIVRASVTAVFAIQPQPALHVILDIQPTPIGHPVHFIHAMTLTAVFALAPQPTNSTYVRLPTMKLPIILVLLVQLLFRTVYNVLWIIVVI